jgi:nucleoside-diphosphate-sugar epimerase
MSPASGLNLLLTGGTGFLGSRVVWALWQSGARLWLLHRRDRPPAMRAHIATLAGLFGGSLRPETPLPSWVPGNLWLPRAGVMPEWIERHRGQFDAIVHMAADTRIRPVRSEDQTQTNLDGTVHMAELAAALGVKRFHHVSTCSVAGTAQGTFTEQDLDVGQSFRTHQEWTKCEAERALRRFSEEHGLTVTIHRPAILIGDSVTGGASAFPHFYQFLSAWRFMAETGVGGQRMMLPFSGEATLHLIPVDHVALGIASALCDPEAEGLTLHWTPREPVTLGELNLALAKLLRAEPVDLDPSASWPASKRSGPAQPLWEWMRSHRAYLTGGIRFSRENADRLCERADLPVPVINGALLQRLHRHWAWATGKI